MGWRAISREGEITSEDQHGRPVQAGEEGKLLFIEQEDYGHRVGIDLASGVILIDYEQPATYQNGTIEIISPKAILFLADDTNIVGEMAHLKSEYTLKRDEKGRKIRDDKGKLVEDRTDHLTPLIFRPIWFTRHISTLPAPIKILGVQTTLPELQGGTNYKKMVILYPDGRIGIS